MNIDTELERMQTLLVANDWNRLEAVYFELCHQLAPETAQAIAAHDLDYYNDRQFNAYCKALKKAKSAQAQAIYFEYDLDNDWRSSYFICPTYTAPEVGNDDWASRWIAEVSGSAIPRFSEIYLATDHFCLTPSATVITLYLIARTTARLCELIVKKPPVHCQICIGYHDQDPIHRIN